MPDTPRFIAVETEAHGSKNSQKIELSDQQYEKLYGLYELALQINFADRKRYFDSSYWCFTTERTDLSLRACFFAVENDYEKRGLIGLYNLGAEIQAILKENAIAY
jgi:hypothetical protein